MFWPMKISLRSSIHDCQLTVDYIIPINSSRIHSPPPTVHTNESRAMILMIDGILGVRCHIMDLLPIIHITVIVRVLHLPFGEMLEDHTTDESE